MAKETNQPAAASNATAGATQTGDAAATGNTTDNNTATDSKGDVNSLLAKVASLEAILAKSTADKAAADKAAADKAEADRVAALSASDKVKEAMAKQQSEIEATRAELVTERRSLALERLGVLPNYRDYAPKVDPKTSDGAAALEKWAKEHPEALARQGAAPVQAIKPMGALAELLAGKRESPLLRGAWAEKIINSMKG